MKKALPLVLALVAAFGVGRLSRPVPEARAGNGDANVPANAYDSGYAPDRGNFKALRTAVATIDTPTTAIVLATPAFQVQGRTTFMLGVRPSASAATVSFRLAYVWRNPAATSDTSVSTRTFSWKTAAWSVPWANQNWTVADNVVKGWSPTYTATAGTVIYEGAYYPTATGDLFLDTERADTIRVIVTTAPSSGTVDFWAGS